MIGRRIATGHSNAVYELETDSGRYVLRAGVGRSAADMEYELAMGRWLRAHGLRAPTAVDDAVKYVRRADTDEPTPSLVLEFIAGEPPASADQAYLVGKELARLHAIPAPEFARRSTATLDAARARALPRLFEALPSVEALAVKLEAESGVETALCHGQLFASNVLISEGAVYFLDLETMGRGAPLLDLGMALFGVGHARLLEGYGGLFDRRRVALAAALAVLKTAWWRHHAGADWQALLEPAKRWLDLSEREVWE